MKYKAICFDIDGTLYPAEFLNKVIKKIALLHPMLSNKYRKTRTYIRKMQDSDNEFSKMTFEDKEALSFAKNAGYKNMEEARKALDDSYYRYLKKEYSKLPKQDNVIKTFLTIRKYGLKIGVFSDWPLWNKLEKIGVRTLCDQVCDCYEGGYLKPGLHAFDVLLNKLEVKPENVLYVGDSYSKDVLGAVKSGMDAVLVNNSVENKDNYDKAINIFENWEQFDNWINSLIEGDNK